MEMEDIFVRLSCNEGLQRRRVPLGSIGFQRLSWASLGVPWGFLEGSLWVPCGFLVGFLWVPFGFLVGSFGILGSLWKPMEPKGTLGL